ncbi:MAG: hypothetical protein P8L77_01485 [Gammaproteobacteria bacterium]|nr:hypothetical protein [Gammaproteobacteria bacterium]
MAFIFSKITPPETKDLLIFAYHNNFVDVQNNYYNATTSYADWLLNKLEDTESTTDTYFKTKISELYSDKQRMKERPGNNFFLNLGGFFKNLFTGFIQFFQDKLLWPLLMISRALVHTIIIELMPIFIIILFTLPYLLGFEHTSTFAASLITYILFLPVITLIGETNYNKEKFEGLIYLSFEVCKSIFTHAIDIVVELLSLICDILGLSLNTTFQFFTNDTFDYGDFIVSPALDSKSLDKGISYQKETTYNQDDLPLLDDSKKIIKDF